MKFAKAGELGRPNRAVSGYPHACLKVDILIGQMQNDCGGRRFTLFNDPDMLSRSNGCLLARSVKAALASNARCFSLQPPLNNSKQAIRRQLDSFVHERNSSPAGALPSYNVTELLRSVKKLGDPVMVSPYFV